VVRSERGGRGRRTDRRTAAAGALLVCALAGACAPRAGPSPTPVWPEAVTAPPVAALPAAPSQTPAAQGCTPDARFVQDLTVPDGTVVAPGETIDKRWEVLNSGTCDWGPGYRLARLGADPLEGPAELALYPARAGAVAIWQVLLTAPSAPGEVVSRWQARAPDGQLFGDEVYLVVVVGPPAP
jgi:hypothetical protein